MNSKEWQVEMLATSGLVTHAVTVGVANGLTTEAAILAALIALVNVCTVEKVKIQTLINEALRASPKSLTDLESQMRKIQ